MNTAELRLRNGLEALRRGDAATAVQHFEKAWEFSARVQAIWSLTYNGDFDRDGVVDVVEMRLGSSPFAADTDNDGLSDAYELNFLIPHTLPNTADTDLGNLKGAYTQWLARHERLAQGWQVIQEAAHVNAPGYDLVLKQGNIYRLVEAKARASLSLTDLHQYVRKHKVTGELRFNAEYFLENLTSLDPRDRDALLRAGNFEIEFYLNGPESARLAQELIAQMGSTVAKYEDDLKNVHEVRIILTAVSR